MAIELFGLEFTGRRFRGQEALPAVPTAFRECSFLGCSVAPHSDRSELVTVEDVSLARCTVAGGGVWGVHLRDITVDTLAVRNLPRITSCVFEHVSLQGRIDQLLIQVGWQYPLGGPDPYLEAMWEAYEQVDWALDISRCDSADLSIRGLPARLIRRDPAFHAVMSRAQALDGAWRRIDLTSTHFAVTIGMLLEEGWKDVVLTAPRSGKRAASAVEALAALRDLGAAD